MHWTRSLPSILGYRQWKHEEVETFMKCETQNIDCETQNTDCDTQNIDCETQNTDCETQNTDCETQNTDCDTQNIDCETQNIDCETQNTDCETQNFASIVIFFHQLLFISFFCRMTPPQRLPRKLTAFWRTSWASTTMNWVRLNLHQSLANLITYSLSSLIIPASSVYWISGRNAFPTFFFCDWNVLLLKNVVFCITLTRGSCGKYKLVQNFEKR